MYIPARIGLGLYRRAVQPPIPPAIFSQYGVFTGFAGSSLTVDDKPFLAVVGTTHFTAECFFRVSDIATAQTIFDIGESGIGITIKNDAIVFTVSGVDNVLYATGDLAGKWNHIALSGSINSGVYAYFNGERAGLLQNIYFWGNGALYIGWSPASYPSKNNFTGSISNFRFTKDHLYTESSYTVPSVPLSGANSVLLLATPSGKYTDTGSDSANTVISGTLPGWTAGPITYGV
jgi:hypothetical protein